VPKSLFPKVNENKEEPEQKESSKENQKHIIADYPIPILKDSVNHS